MEQSIGVLVADDHPLVRAAVSDLLDAADGVSVVGQATDGQEALDLAEKLRPDVVLMDVSMPAVSGIEATRLLTAQHPDLTVLMFSADVRCSVVQAARAAGAAGFLAKGCRGTELIRAIERVHSGRPVWPSYGQLPQGHQ